ncbi:hypothetical protein EVAR_14115_1 [Eumeta japonica]|uniref:Uncharacterized protein n=1 Tax=Eumeta variegata TaxID=151549 RepID=A0A4C1UQ07_EUMVA|nr:hypothetical protein EVAR_14115_1 [Eumeta japonica]
MRRRVKAPVNARGRSCRLTSSKRQVFSQLEAATPFDLGARPRARGRAPPALPAVRRAATESFGPDLQVRVDTLVGYPIPININKLASFARPKRTPRPFPPPLRQRKGFTCAYGRLCLLKPATPAGTRDEAAQAER